MMDAGYLTICDLENQAEAAAMPKEALVKGNKWLFEVRTLGYGRQYAAKGVNEQVDLLVRIWRDETAGIGCYALLENSRYDGQYRIDNVQQLFDDDGLEVTDLTLRRLDNLYDVINGEA